jgi:hypothetical protein
VPTSPPSAAGSPVPTLPTARDCSRHTLPADLLQPPRALTSSRSVEDALATFVPAAVPGHVGAIAWSERKGAERSKIEGSQHWGAPWTGSIQALLGLSSNRAGGVALPEASGADALREERCPCSSFARSIFPGGGSFFDLLRLQSLGTHLALFVEQTTRRTCSLNFEPRAPVNTPDTVAILQNPSSRRGRPCPSRGDSSAWRDRRGI